MQVDALIAQPIDGRKVMVKVGAVDGNERRARRKSIESRTFGLHADPDMRSLQIGNDLMEEPGTVSIDGTVPSLNRSGGRRVVPVSWAAGYGAR